MTEKRNIMQTRVEETIARHNKGYNCAQAVACTYCDLVGTDEATMFKMTEAFGLGMGNMEGTCGAISGAIAIAGMKNSTANLENPDSKKDTYRIGKEIMDRFAAKNSTVTCKMLKGKETGKVLRTCPECIKDAAEILETVLFNTDIGA